MIVFCVDIFLLFTVELSRRRTHAGVVLSKMQRVGLLGAPREFGVRASVRLSNVITRRICGGNVCKIPKSILDDLVENELQAVGSTP